MPPQWNQLLRCDAVEAAGQPDCGNRLAFYAGVRVGFKAMMREQAPAAASQAAPPAVAFGSVLSLAASVATRRGGANGSHPNAATAVTGSRPKKEDGHEKKSAARPGDCGNAVPAPAQAGVEPVANNAVPMQAPDGRSVAVSIEAPELAVVADVCSGVTSGAAPLTQHGFGPVDAPGESDGSERPSDASGGMVERAKADAETDSAPGAVVREDALNGTAYFGAVAGEEDGPVQQTPDVLVPEQGSVTVGAVRAAKRAAEISGGLDAANAQRAAGTKEQADIMAAVVAELTRPEVPLAPLASAQVDVQSASDGNAPAGVRTKIIGAVVGIGRGREAAASVADGSKQTVSNVHAPAVRVEVDANSGSLAGDVGSQQSGSADSGTGSKDDGIANLVSHELHAVQRLHAAQADGASVAAGEPVAVSTSVPLIGADAMHRHDAAVDDARAIGQGVGAAATRPEVPAPGASGIDSARLMRTMGESEMRVGLHSAEFGSIAIRTSVAEQQMVARISLEHSDLGQEIANHAPVLETKLGSEYGLHARIEVADQTTMFSGGQQGASHQEQRPRTQPVMSVQQMGAVEADAAAVMPIAYQQGYQLDVQA